MVMEEMAPLASSSRVTATGPPKPCALAVLGDPPPLRSEIYLPARLIPPLTAEEVRVAPELASMVFSPLGSFPLTRVRGTFLPMYCWVNAGSLAKAPRPGVSLKFSPPTSTPVITPSISMPSVTTTSPP